MKRLSLAALALLALSCGPREREVQQPALSGNTARGRELLVQYACTACHTVPGTSGLQGTLGPSLAGVASRPTISNGVVPNSPANLRTFIQSPAALNPQSAMPPIGLPDSDAQDITLFLLTLK